MAKRIGSFTNPNTGEADWIELDTINQIILQPRMVTKVGDTSSTAVDFKITYVESKDEAQLIAIYKNNGNNIESTPVIMDQETFASQFAEKIYAEKSFDEAQLIIDSKEKAMQNLTAALMDAGILLGGMQFAGFGFVTVDGDKVLTLESLDFNYEVQSGKPVRTAVLHNCVGQASLKNLEDPKIVFYTGTYKVEMVGVTVENDVEGRVKKYDIGIHDIIVAKDTTMPEHQEFSNLNGNLDNDEFLNTFITERKSHLDDDLGTEDIDDRLGDLFDL